MTGRGDGIYLRGPTAVRPKASVSAKLAKRKGAPVAQADRAAVS
jgi:hypothetical protein